MAKDFDVKIIEEICSDITKHYGEGAMIIGNDFSIECDVISTNCIALDVALGVGGLPRGRIIEIFGPEASGKTTLAMQVIANAQKQGLAVAFLDVEHAVNPGYCRDIGVDFDKLLFSQPDSGEQTLQICDRLIHTGKVAVIVIDSVAALVPQSELDGDIGDPSIGAQARLMSQSLRKLAGSAKSTNTMIIFINQIREKIGAMSFGGGAPTSTPGGRALKFWASVRIDIRRIGSIKQGEEHIGNVTKVKIVKNKVAAPFKEATFDIHYGTDMPRKGISRSASLIDMGSDKAVKLIGKNGSYFSFGEHKLGNGKINACIFLDNNPEIADELEQAIRAKLNEK